MATARPSPGGRLRLLRMAAAIVLGIGAASSVALMVRAGSRAPQPVLLAIFLVWVVAPFAAMAWAMRAASGWSARGCVVLYVTALAVSAGAVAIYSGLIAPPAGSPNAFIYLVVPAASWVIMALAGVFVFVSRKPAAR